MSGLVVRVTGWTFVEDEGGVKNHDDYEINVEYYAELRDADALLAPRGIDERLADGRIKRVSQVRRSFAACKTLHKAIGPSLGIHLATPKRTDKRHANLVYVLPREHRERIAILDVYLNEALRTCLLAHRRPPPDLLLFLGVTDYDALGGKITSLAALAAAPDATAPIPPQDDTTPKTASEKLDKALPTAPSTPPADATSTTRTPTTQVGARTKNVGVRFSPSALVRAPAESRRVVRPVKQYRMLRTLSLVAFCVGLLAALTYSASRAGIVSFPTLWAHAGDGTATAGQLRAVPPTSRYSLWHQATPASAHTPTKTPLILAREAMQRVTEPIFAQSVAASASSSPSAAYAAGDSLSSPRDAVRKGWPLRRLLRNTMKQLTRPSFVAPLIVFSVLQAVPGVGTAAAPATVPALVTKRLVVSAPSAAHQSTVVTAGGAFLGSVLMRRLTRGGARGAAMQKAGEAFARPATSGFARRLAQMALHFHTEATARVTSLATAALL